MSADLRCALLLSIFAWMCAHSGPSSEVIMSTHTRTDTLTHTHTHTHTHARAHTFLDSSPHPCSCVNVVGRLRMFSLAAAGREEEEGRGERRRRRRGDWHEFLSAPQISCSLYGPPARLRPDAHPDRFLSPPPPKHISELSCFPTNTVTYYITQKSRIVVETDGYV